ncbi:spiroplasma phage ORF1-like family protein, partial [Spiroplasma phoeniceum]|uniref:spiroplasma phage ORF1-like family protein n=1 Tax=Spiroplasma phoeniceum TaxID=47835 RepID=UPI0033652CFE
MRKFLVLFSFIPILLISFFSLGAMTLQQNHQLQQTAEKARIKRSVKTGINETDFINTMFLRSTFFENWSDTNYFINPTLKTSKSLTYNDKWYLDFLKDSYSTGVSYDKPSDKFINLYKNWNIYAEQYNINKFYDVDRKQFLRELTNFIYSFTIKYNLTQMLNKLKTNITDLQQVNLIENNWKLMNEIIDFWDLTPNNKWYILLLNNYVSNNWNIMKIHLTMDPYDIIFEPKNLLKSVYLWYGEDEPETPTINSNGKITNWNINIQNKVKDFLNNYLDVIIQENIRVQQGGNPNYESSIVGTQRIIFDFEIVD